MKKFMSIALVAFAALSLSLSTGAQSPTNPLGPTFDVGIFYSPGYNYGGPGSANPSQMTVTSGTSATGAGTVTLAYGYFITQDGRKITPFTNVSQNALTIPAITIDNGANVETVTPSAVSCQTPDVINTCQVTATFSFIHGAGVRLASGDQGIQEAINDAALNGGGSVYWVIDSGGPIALATGSASTLFGINIPTRSTVQGASAKVTTTITGCTGGWSLGFSSGTEFSAANTTLTAGTTTDSSTLVYNVAFNAAAVQPKIFCTTANATAGAVHARVWGFKVAAPAY